MPGRGGHFGAYTGAGLIAAAAFLGLGSILVLAGNACRSSAHMGALLTATFCPALVIFTKVALTVVIRLSPRIFDLYLYRLLGLQFSFLIGQWFVRLPFVYTLCSLVYSGLPLAEVLAFLLFLRGHRMDANPLGLLAVAVAGFLFYQVCPATGPVHVFGAVFPQSPQHFVPLQTIPSADIPRNAISSPHRP